MLSLGSAWPCRSPGRSSARRIGGEANPRVLARGARNWGRTSLLRPGSRSFPLHIGGSTVISESQKKPDQIRGPGLSSARLLCSRRRRAFCAWRADRRVSPKNAETPSSVPATYTDGDGVIDCFTVQTFADMAARITYNSTFADQIQRIIEGLCKAGVLEGEKKTN